MTHTDTPQRGRCYRVRLKSQWADKDRWIYPRRNFDNLPRALCEEYDATLLHTAEALTASLIRDYPTKPSESDQQLERPILYISHSTLPYETCYEASELQMACLAWAVGRLRQYLEGAPFKVFTDHSAIPGIFRSSASTSYSLHLDKFRMQLIPFVDNMGITHQHGKSILHFDCSSRNVGTGKSQSETGGTVGESLAPWIVESRGHRTKLACWEPAGTDEARRLGG
jgi:hypothetical protein